MREIKFRAWDTAKKIMYSAGELGKDELCLNPDGRGFVNVSSADQRFSQYMRHIVPLQYTGLKDSKGKEIYEEDIIHTDDFSYGIFNAVVRWNEEEGMFAIRTFSPSPKQIKMPNREWDRKHPPCGSDGCLYAMWYTPIGNQKGLEVIGNIHENPELLEP